MLPQPPTETETHKFSRKHTKVAKNHQFNTHSQPL